MRNTVRKKLLRIRAIEEEYGEPLRDIITGFREQGCSWDTIEGALEISHSALWQWRKDLGLLHDKRINYENRDSKSNAVARRMGYRDFKTMYREMRQQGMTLKQISRKTGLAESTISGNAPEEMKYQWIVTPKLRRARLQNIARGREIQIQKRRALKIELGYIENDNIA